MEILKPVVQPSIGGDAIYMTLVSNYLLQFSGDIDIRIISERDPDEPGLETRRGGRVLSRNKPVHAFVNVTLPPAPHRD